MGLPVEKFDTNEEANDALAIKLRNLTTCQTVGERFCPIVNGACVTNCVCFGLPHISGSKMSGWRMYPHYCTNSMFTGYVEE
jgi:hypothetical protein